MPDTARRLLDIYRALFERYGPQHWWPADTPFEVVIGAILTQNTSWKNVEKAISNLRSESLLSPAAILDCPDTMLQRAIRPAGYYRQKTTYVKQFCMGLVEQYDGSLDRLFDQPPDRLRTALLVSRGIGPETADSIILYAAGKPSFVIDAYTLRIFARLGDLPAKTGYSEARNFFMQHLRHDTALFNEYHALVVAHAKASCRKTTPLCSGCPLAGFCRYGQSTNDGLTGPQ